MPTYIPTFTESLTGALERFGDATGTEAQGDKSMSLLRTAVALMDAEASASFFSGQGMPEGVTNIEELAASLERLGDKDGTEAQADRTQGYLTASLDLMLPEAMETFLADEELVSLLREFGGADEE